MPKFTIGGVNLGLSTSAIRGWSGWGAEFSPGPTGAMDARYRPVASATDSPIPVVLGDEVKLANPSPPLAMYELMATV
eukprot:1125932-Prymnesium_polylepis.1